jgi:hypothetical protein
VRSSFRFVHLATTRSTLPDRSPDAQLQQQPGFGKRTHLTQSLEPVLIPKLRTEFADFPYPHYSNHQRLRTLRTCCGYRYVQESDKSCPRLFKGHRERTGHPKSWMLFPVMFPFLRINRFQGVLTVRKKRKLFPGPPLTSPR